LKQSHEGHAQEVWSSGFVLMLQFEALFAIKSNHILNFPSLPSAMDFESVYKLSVFRKYIVIPLFYLHKLFVSYMPGVYYKI